MNLISSLSCEKESIGGMAIARDIIELKKAKILYKSILDNSVDAPYRRNLLNDSYDYFGPAIERITGFSVEEVLNMGPKGILERVHPDDLSKVINQKMNMKSSFSQSIVEYRFLCKDGAYKWISDHFKIVYDENKTPIIREGVVRDISDLSKAEKELKQSEARFRSVFNNSPDVIYRFNLQSGKYEFMSPSIKKLGFEPEALMSMSNDEVLLRVHPEDRSVLISVLSEINDVGGGSCEYRFKGNDGKYRWWSNRMVIIKDSEKQPLYRDGFVRDITEQKKSIMDLKESSLRYRTLMETIPDAILVHEEGIVCFVNIAALKLFKASNKNELLGKSLFSFFPKNTHDIIRKRIKQAATERTPLKEYKIIRPDGSTFDGEITGKNILIHGKIATQIIIRDITERKKAERDLKEREEKYHQLHKTMRDAYISVTMDGRIHEYNDLFINMLGYDDEELNKLTYKNLTPKKWHDYEQEIVEKQILERGYSDVYEKEYIRKDGSIFPIELKTFLLKDQSGNPLYMWATVRDITERKKTEKAMKNIINKLEISNQELEQFAYVASHDLQEPLRMVTSFSQLLEMKYKDKLDEDADEYIDFIIEGAHRMKDLIDDLLAYSRLNTLKKEFQSTDLNQLLDNIILNLKSAIEKVDAKITHDDLPVVKCDSTQIGQVFQNLISNSIKFHKTPPRIHISAEESNNEWILGVSDKGIGIDPEYQQKIFELFRRLHTREEYSGTGIGLSICKRIIERHNGRIWVESEPGKGANFYFTIPK